MHRTQQCAMSERGKFFKINCERKMEVSSFGPSCEAQFRRRLMEIALRLLARRALFAYRALNHFVAMRLHSEAKKLKE